MASELEGVASGDPAMPLSHLIEINALTLDGTDGPRLSANVSFASRLLCEDQVRDLAERWFAALEALVRHVQQDAAAGGRTPSDLALVELSQSEIEELESRHRPIEDILPLSPLQEGLLFHALYDAGGPDVYTVQLELELDGALDGAVLQASVDAVVNRHASLRAAFRHERLNRPVQVIARRVGVPWRLHDVSELSHDEQQAAACGDPGRRPPGAVRPGRVRRLMRFALIRLSEQHHRLLISNHHLLMDGWSAPVLVSEVLAAYAERGSAASLPRRDAVPRLSGVHRRAGPHGGARRLARVAQRTRRGHAACAAVHAGRSRGGAGAGGAVARCRGCLIRSAVSAGSGR